MQCFGKQLASGRPLLGLDVGTKTIGVAISDTRCVLASPMITIGRSRIASDLNKIVDLSLSRLTAGVVIGLPKNMNGTEGPGCQSVREFGRRLSRKLNAPIAYWDERLTTVAAERSMIEGGLSRKRRAELVNHVAASLILQGALDRLAATRHQE